MNKLSNFYFELKSKLNLMELHVTALASSKGGILSKLVKSLTFFLSRFVCVSVS